MTTKTKKPAASKKSPAKKLDAPKLLGVKSIKVETNAKGEVRKIEAAPAPKARAASKQPTLKDLGKKPAGEARNSALPPEGKITCMMKENPSRPGTVAYKARELYRTCKTVGEWRERAADLDLGYLVNDIRRGFVKVAVPSAPAK